MRIPFLKKEGYEADDIIAHAGDPGAGRRVRHRRRADPHRRPRLDPAGHRPVDGPLPDARGLRPGADDPGLRRGPLRRCRPERYPELAALVGETSDNLPGRPGSGPGLRRQVAQPVRRPRQRHHPRRRDHRQEGRGTARAPRRRDPQPPAQRAGHRPRARGRPDRPGLAVLGPAGGAHALRRARVRRCSAPGCSRRSRPRRRRRSTTPGFDVSMRVLDDRRAARLARRARVASGGSGSASTRSATGRPAPATCSRWRSPPRRVPPTSPPTSSTSTTRRRWPPGSRTPPSPRCSTTPRGRCSPSPRGGCRSPAWSATPRCRRTSPGPTSAPTTWPT